MQNKRKKGLDSCGRAAKILKRLGHEVDGPFSKVTFHKGRKMASHVDVFGVFDLISFNGDSGRYEGHQVTALNMKSRKLKNIKKAGLTGFIWCEAVVDGRPGFRRFYVGKDDTYEITSVWD